MTSECYLCTVEDGNETPFDKQKHALCLRCKAKLRRIAMDCDGVFMFLMGYNTVILSADRDLDLAVHQIRKTIVHQLEMSKQPIPSRDHLDNLVKHIVGGLDAYGFEDSDDQNR